MKCMEEKNRGLAAEELFERGYNCAQAVAGAFADQMGMPQSQVLQLAGGFGGGVGRLREICGAVSGMAMVLSAVYGCDAPDDEKKAALYARIQRCAKAFEEHHGSYLCHELLKDSEPTQGVYPEKRDEGYYHRRPCAKLVADAAMIVVRELSMAQRPESEE